MKCPVSQGSARTARILRNPHFWGIVVIMLGLTFLYYSDIFFTGFFAHRWRWFWHLVIFEFNNDIHGSLFIVPFIYAAIIFWWRGILLTWLFAVIILIPRISHYAPNVNSMITNVFLLLVPLLIVSILALQIKWRESEKKAAEERERERQSYLARVFISQEEERKRISREIHDDTTQRLWIVANDLRKLAVEAGQKTDLVLSHELEAIKDTVLNIAEDTKRLSLALRPGILDNLGLVSAIRWLADQLGRDGSIQTSFAVEGHERPLSQDVNNHLFRIAQEALNNVRRHAEATQVNIKLAFTDDTVKLAVHDNGKGFLVKDLSSPHSGGGMGIIGMQERARLLNGKLQIISKPAKGTTVTIEFKDKASPACLG